MLETLNNVGCIARARLRKNIPRGCQYEHETTWQPCLFAISCTSKAVVDRVLVNWK